MASRVALAFVVFALNGRCLFAQITAEPASLRGDSPQTRKRLAEAEKRVLSGKADEVATAVEELQRILDEGGDDLISLDGKLHRAARWIAHPILAKLPHDALKSYRDRIEEPARKLLDAGKRDRDIRPLWQLLDRYFVSRPADEGSLLLGDLLFERGDFRTAELVWKRLLPESDADVAYPGSRSEAAAVQARIILAAVFAGEAECAKEAFAEFQKKHSKASGSLGGKTGLYADVLKEFVDRPPPVSASWDRNWPTFGGDPARSGRIPGPLAIRRAPRPTWTEPIPFDFRIPNSSFRHPVGHPVVLNGWVYVADPYHVAAFELKTGLYRSVYSLGRAEFPEPVKKPDPNAKSVEPPPTSPTLTAWNGRLYARLGHPSLKPGVRPEDSAIICFAPLAKPGRESPPLREQWRIYPPVVDGKPGSAWEGAPLIAQGRLWAAFARFEGGRVVHSIACYDPADSDSAPERPAWVAEVADCAVLSNSEVQARGRQELLTLAGRYIVFCTNAGAVVALDAATGHRAWAVQYPRSVRRVVESNRSPDPSPAVVYGGRIFVAPADADRVFAFDAETGNELWESGALEGGQILGVARNRLVVSSTGPVQGIRGLNVATGSYHAPEGWIQASGLLGYGQGLVSDDIILWPSRAGLFFLDPLSGSVIASLKTMGSDPQLFGNLAVADGWLVVVSSTQVWAYYTDEPPYIRPPDL